MSDTFRHTHQPTPWRYSTVTSTGLPCCFMVTCDRCGAVVLIRTVTQHDQWHQDLVATTTHQTPMGVRP